MDSPKTTTRAGSRSRRKIFSCPVCDEVFIDEESLRRHELTHQNPEGEAPPPEATAEPAPPAPEPAAEPAAEPSEESPAPPRRTLSSVRRQAQQQQAQVEPQSNFLPPAENAPAAEMALDPDATLKVAQEAPALAPLAWEKPEASSTGSSFGLGPLWRFIEDFSEWFVRGSTKTVGVVGFSVLSGVGLALRGLIVLAVAAACVYAGIWVGRIYGPQSNDEPVIPPVRTVQNSPEANQEAVKDLVVGFYDDISQKQYKSAYTALSPDWQKEMSFEAFQAGYKDTQSAACAVKSLRSLAGGRYQMEISLDVTERGRKSHLNGTYIAVYTAKGWKLDQGSLR